MSYPGIAKEWKWTGAESAPKVHEPTAQNRRRRDCQTDSYTPDLQNLSGYAFFGNTYAYICVVLRPFSTKFCLFLSSIMVHFQAEDHGTKVEVIFSSVALTTGRFLI